ncbi:HemK family protein methyltransferase [Candidatus Legionella polyplacis]|uniref:peptide chain release factor N(5)-glutamine methyltransferase n=1 Tax=Candidatus Legionella polyplacis TaxID=2005262 RepID=A0ABZ2GZW1_9GAMM|nr:HemK family protein methyltransferase [Candidatus Legionella polyplacis]
MALASENPQWNITACDCSKKALKIAKYNSIKLNLNNIKYILSNWFDSINYPKYFDLIISNPPYISKNELHYLNHEVYFEPNIALFGGKNGLQKIYTIIQKSLKRLKPGGYLLIEHGFNQKYPIQLFLKKHNFININSWNDLNNQPRITIGKKPIKTS